MAASLRSILSYNDDWTPATGRPDRDPAAVLGSALSPARDIAGSRSSLQLQLWHHSPVCRCPAESPRPSVLSVYAVPPVFSVPMEI